MALCDSIPLNCKSILVSLALFRNFSDTNVVSRSRRMMYGKQVRNVVQQPMKFCQQSSIDLLLVNFSFWKFVAVSKMCSNGLLLRCIRSIASSRLKITFSGGNIVRNRNG